ncbi:MAG TPA: glycosyltransferase family 4 protein [Elusimicrobiales bacterium]|nr:glycosyltransferase family 4 protein [Elusimicrobiales bacterium]
MNILNICDTQVWDLVAYQALHTAARFVKTGHNAAVLCHKNSRLDEECRKLKVNTLPITLGLKFGFFETGGWDIVHFYNPDSMNPLFLKKARASSKIFVTQLKLGNPRAFEKLSLLEPYVDRYVAACNSVQEEFARSGIDQRKTFTVPPALNLGRWESAMLIKPAMFLRRPYRVGMVSMDPSLKEQELFLLMAKEVLYVLPNTNFLIVGIKDERLRDMARKLGISHKVDVLWERNDMPEVMAMMHIYAKTAVREGLSMSLIEAQASGVACVVPRLRGLSDFVVCDRNAIIVEPGDVLACTKAVVHLINNPPVCHTMSKMAFDYVSNNMSLPVVCNLLLRLYEEALA